MLPTCTDIRSASSPCAGTPPAGREPGRPHSPRGQQGGPHGRGAAGHEVAEGRHLRQELEVIAKQLRGLAEGQARVGSALSEVRRDVAGLPAALLSAASAASALVVPRTEASGDGDSHGHRHRHHERHQHRHHAQNPPEPPSTPQKLGPGKLGAESDGCGNEKAADGSPWPASAEHSQQAGSADGFADGAAAPSAERAPEAPPQPETPPQLPKAVACEAYGWITGNAHDPSEAQHRAGEVWDLAHAQGWTPPLTRSQARVRQSSDLARTKAFAKVWSSSQDGEGRRAWALEDLSAWLGQTAAKLYACLVRLVLSDYFDALSALLIVLHTALLGAQVEHLARNNLREPSGFYENISISFTCIFMLELLLRLLVARKAFFSSDEIAWNVFDSVAVFLSLVEMLVTVFSTGASPNLLSFRVLRILRIVRIVRVIRVFRFFHELRMMVYSILLSGRSLLWAILLLCIIVYVAAVYLTQVAIEYKTGVDPEAWLVDSLDRYYCSIWTAMYFIFQGISSGVNWGEVAAPLVELHWFYAIVYSLLTCFTMFLVLNIVTAVFVETALQCAQQDRDLQIQMLLESDSRSVKQLQQLFVETDYDGSGFISLDEFEKICADKRAKIAFKALGLDISEAYGLFRLLDIDSSETVCISEFVMGCLRLNGNAKNVDVATLMYENKRMMQKWSKFMRFVAQQFARLTQFENHIVSKDVKGHVDLLPGVEATEVPTMSWAVESAGPRHRRAAGTPAAGTSPSQTPAKPGT